MLMKARQSTRAALEELLAQRILILDGSMGALIYSRQPTEEDYRGQRFRNHPVPLKNCTEVLVLTQPRFVAGSIGPTNKSLSMATHVEDPGRRDVTFDQMVAAYTEQVHALTEGGVDILLAETSFDTLVMKACLFAIAQYFEEHDVSL